MTDIAFRFNGDTEEEWERVDREVVDMVALYVGVLVP